MPTPAANEDKETFMERCMGMDMMNEEYPDEKQRYAVCLSHWEDKEKKANNNNSMESRTFKFDFNSIENRKSESPMIKGHAAIFEEKVSMPFLGFDEMVGKNAFTDTIKKDDVRALFNHDANYVLGRNKSGTLKLKEDERGLAIEIDPPKTQFAKDLMELIDRGDINQMSFAFQIEKEGWEKGKEGKADLRILERVKLYDISIVTFPTYEGTTVALRSYNKWLQEIKKPDIFKIKLLQRRLNLIQRKGGMNNG